MQQYTYYWEPHPSLILVETSLTSLYYSTISICKAHFRQKTEICADLVFYFVLSVVPLETLEDLKCLTELFFQQMTENKKEQIDQACITISTVLWYRLLYQFCWIVCVLMYQGESQKLHWAEYYGDLKCAWDIKLIYKKPTAKASKNPLWYSLPYLKHIDKDMPLIHTQEQSVIFFYGVLLYKYTINRVYLKSIEKGSLFFPFSTTLPQLKIDRFGSQWCVVNIKPGWDWLQKRTVIWKCFRCMFDYY